MDLEFRKKTQPHPLHPPIKRAGAGKLSRPGGGFMAEVAARVTQRSGDSGSRMGKETLKESRGASYTHRPLRPPTAKTVAPSTKSACLPLGLDPVLCPQDGSHASK